MAVRKAKGRGAQAAAPAKPQPAGHWETAVQPFLERYWHVLSVCLVLIASIRIVSTFSALSLTWDEPGHFACGLQYLSEHIYRYESQHPPLARAATAIGPYLAGVRPIGGPEQNLEGVNIIKATGQVDRMAFLMRIGILPFFWIACLVVYLWTRRYTSAGVAVIATGLFTLTPPVLAHAGLATTDMALTGCLLAAFLSLLVWAEAPTWRSGAVLGVTAALAGLSKFTAIGYLPAAAVLSLVFWLGVKRPPMHRLSELARERLATFGFAVAVGFLTVWAAYWFSFGIVPKWGVKLPAPEFFDGILAASSHNSGGHAAYNLGEVSFKGWWYFFPVALAVKTPLALLLLCIPGIWAVWRKRSQPGYLTVAAFFLGILLPAMTSHVNIGVRHVLPIYAALAIFAALGCERLISFAGTPALALVFCGAPIVWIVLSGARAHPDYLSYFNELAGDDPGKILVDSDLDWGQDYKRLEQRLREVHADHVAVKFNETIIYTNLYHLPAARQVDDTRPLEGWNVIGPTVSKHMVAQSAMRGIDAKSVEEAMRPPWFERLAPTEKVGALRLFYVPAGSPLLKE